MSDGQNEPDISGAVEAILFVTDTPLSTVTMADILRVSPAVVESACDALQKRLSGDESGIMLTEVAGGWRLATKATYHDLLERYILTWDTRRLSQAALEVLAIIAYTQPVTRAGVANIRGVNSDSSINSLLEKALIREAGEADTPGNPVLYATSKTFLEKFGLTSVENLPSLDDFAPDEKTRAVIRTRLSVAHGFIPSSREEADAEGMEGATSAEDAESAEKTKGTKESAALTFEKTYSDAFADAVGVVEKIDFDDLEFEE